MNTHWLRMLLMAFVLGCGVSGAAQAADGTVTILSPADGAWLDSMEKASIRFAAEPGTAGDHVQLFVDDCEVAVLFELSGDYAMPMLIPGPRDVCIKLVDKGNTPVGVEKCITVMVD